MAPAKNRALGGVRHQKSSGGPLGLKCDTIAGRSSSTVRYRTSRLMSK